MSLHIWYFPDQKQSIKFTWKLAIGDRRSHGWKLRNLSFNGGVVSPFTQFRATELTRLSTWWHSSHESNGAIPRCNSLPLHAIFYGNRFRDSSIWFTFTLQNSQSRTVWHDMIGRHCPIFAVNREVSSIRVLVLISGNSSCGLLISGVIFMCRRWFRYLSPLDILELIRIKCMARVLIYFRMEICHMVWECLNITGAGRDVFKLLCLIAWCWDLFLKPSLKCLLMIICLKWQCSHLWNAYFWASCSWHRVVKSFGMIVHCSFWILVETFNPWGRF